jgi:tetratricopeptide (TPR) repeat protein
VKLGQRARIARRRPRLSARAAVLAFLMAAVAGAAGAQEGTAALFVTSDPIGAAVLQDGQLLEGRTPLLLRGLAPGRHRFELRAEGCVTGTVAVTLEGGEVRSIRATLVRESLRPSFPEEGRVAIGGTETEAVDRLFELPQGSYRLRRGRDGTLRIEPQYPLQGLLTGLDLATPLALGLSAVLTAHDVFYPKEVSLRLSPGLALSAPTMAAYGLTLALLGFDVTLHVLKARSLRSFHYSVLAAEESSRQCVEQFRRAETLLALGQLEEALHFYTLVVERCKSSPLFPEALFKIARIHALSGEQTMAAMELRLVAERYPLPELYDKARKSLAELAAQRGEYAESLAQLDAMVFADPLYVPEEIDQYRGEILRLWSGADPAVLPRLVAHYEVMVRRYGSSQELPRYRFELALALHRSGRSVEAAAQLEQIPRADLDPQLAEQVRLLEAAVGEGR